MSGFYFWNGGEYSRLELVETPGGVVGAVFKPGVAAIGTAARYAAVEALVAAEVAAKRFWDPKLVAMTKVDDWLQAMPFAMKRPIASQQFGWTDIKRVLASSTGRNEELDWIALFELWDGRIGWLEAWCNYTGWESQAKGSSRVHPTLEHAINLCMSPEDRTRLGLELKTHWRSGGGQPTSPRATLTKAGWRALGAQWWLEEEQGDEHNTVTLNIERADGSSAYRHQCRTTRQLAEAEALRIGAEKLIAQWGGTYTGTSPPGDALQHLLDRVAAEDSLHYLDRLEAAEDDKRRLIDVILAQPGAGQPRALRGLSLCATLTLLGFTHGASTALPHGSHDVRDDGVTVFMGPAAAVWEWLDKRFPGLLPPEPEAG